MATLAITFLHWKKKCFEVFELSADFRCCHQFIFIPNSRSNKWFGEFNYKNTYWFSAQALLRCIPATVWFVDYFSDDPGTISRCFRSRMILFFTRRWKSIAVHAHPFSGWVTQYIIIIQFYWRIKTGRCFFIGMENADPYILLSVMVHTCHWHQQNIAIITAARSAEMYVKPINIIIWIMIAAATIPSFQSCIRT